MSAPRGLSCTASRRPWRERLAAAFYAACDVLAVPSLIVLVPLAIWRLTP